MRILYIVFIGLTFLSTNSAAQDKTGVWRGIVAFFPPGNSSSQMAALPSIGGEVRSSRRANQVPIRINENSPAMRFYANAPPEFLTNAKLEIIEADERMLAQLTSYSDDYKLVTMYQFYVRPTPKEFYKYHLQAKSILVNETIRKADLFDLRGSFIHTDSGTVFRGIWEDPFGRRRFGNFAFQASDEAITINPELWHGFIKKQQINEATLAPERQFKPTPLFDTLVTDAPAVYANLVDNGVIDQDTLSVWLNGRLIEDDIVPGKKPFYFRINLGEEEWNHFTIRCKSEGKEKGTGVHLNLQLQDVQLKYNLALYQYHQAEWVIRRKNSVKSK
jgi:hypothetical protein